MTVTSQKTTPQPAESVKDTIESIIVAFILAFVFRAFIVEAFVIPTGSMAPTLYGVHGQQTCQDCGTSYAFGLKEQPSNDNPIRTCPNCRHDDTQPTVGLGGRLSGDRILVLKWPFDIGGEWLGPKRWDVVVFKDPADGVTNFIKRLVGMPSEVLEIIDGDIYTVPVSTIEQKDPGLLDLLHERRELAARYGRLAALGDYAERRNLEQRLDAVTQRVLPRLDPLYTIRRKSDTRVGRRVQKSLWLPVHDQGYLPHLDRSGPRIPAWKPTDSDSHWDATSVVVRFSGVDSDEQGLRFQPTNRRIYDYYAYNETLPAPAELYPVTDLRLSFLLTVHSGDGYVRLEMPKSPDRFFVTLHQDGRIEWERHGVSVATSEKYTPVTVSELSPGRPVKVELANLDHRLSLTLNGREVLSKAYTSSLTLDELRRQSDRVNGVDQGVAISAERIDLSLRHLTLHRDVYYQETTIRGESRTANKSNGWTGRDGWGSRGNPIFLREKEYYVLGDNSPQSADSRLWGTIGDHLVPRGLDYQVGTVPEDQLIGRAFFVYWPSGFRLFPAKSGTRLPWNLRVVPNVGDMRWIH